MKFPSKRVMLLNGAAFLVMAAGAIAAVRHNISPPQSAPCSERYGRLTTFQLERDGTLLSSSEIQAASDGLDRGVDTNLAVRRIKDGPATTALGVTMDAGTGPTGTKVGKAGGVSFPWVPRALPDKVEAACLSYDVFLGADFEFAGGGTLPGILGNQDGELISNQSADRFDVHAQWGPLGLAKQYMVLSTAKNALDLTVPAFTYTFPRGRWFKIEQEVVLNAPGQQNGIVRLWVDGRLRLEGRDAELRYRPDVYVAGVVADTHFGGQYLDSRAAKKEQIWLTPFQLRWN
jgi:hypothetical protein